MFLRSYIYSLIVILAGCLSSTLVLLHGSSNNDFLVKLSIDPELADQANRINEIKETESQDYLISSSLVEEVGPGLTSGWTPRSTPIPLYSTSEPVTILNSPDQHKNKLEKIVANKLNITEPANEHKVNLDITDKVLSMKELLKMLLFQPRVKTAVPSDKTCMAALTEKMATYDVKLTKSLVNLQIVFDLIQKTCQASTFCSPSLKNATHCPIKVKIDKQYSTDWKSEIVKADCIIECIL